MQSLTSQLHPASRSNHPSASLWLSLATLLCSSWTLLPWRSTAVIGVDGFSSSRPLQQRPYSSGLVGLLTSPSRCTRRSRQPFPFLDAMSSLPSYSGTTVTFASCSRNRGWRKIHHTSCTSRSFSIPTALYYKDDGSASDNKKSNVEDDEASSDRRLTSGETESSSSLSSPSASSPNRSPRRSGVLTIPVVGPLPGHIPLMMGAEMFLDTPTPMQWQALEEAVMIHERHCQPQQPEQGDDGDVHHHHHHDDDDPTQSTSEWCGVDAAPLVAIMDDYTIGDMTGGAPVAYPRKGRYATIAAVVGTSASTKNKKKYNGGNGTIPSIDTSDESSFMESLMRITASGGKLPTDQRVRLVGVGRAVLYDFYYQVPMRVLEETMDEEGHLMNVPDPPRTMMVYKDEEMGQPIEDTNHKVDDDDDYKVKIIMAEFRIVFDQEQFSKSYQLRFNRPSKVSPMHAIAEMSKLSNRLQYLHEERKRLVAGLHAAKARLQWAGLHDDLFDYDGIGNIFIKGVDNTTIDADRDETIGGAIDAVDIVSTDDSPSSNVPEVTMSTTLKPDDEGPLAKMENYGLGFSPASFSTLPSLTAVWLEKLSPYYSPTRCQTEEHYYEVMSFVSMLTMEKYLAPSEMGWSLHCINTIERLEQAYDWMWMHVRLLREEAASVSQTLRECGEECTDLF